MKRTKLSGKGERVSQTALSKGESDAPPQEHYREMVVSAVSVSQLALEQAREELLLDGGAVGVLKNVREMAQKRLRNTGWARLFCELMGWVGTREQIMNALVLHLGVSVERAKLAVDMVGRLPDDPHAVAAECRAYLEWYDGPSGPGKAEVVE